MGLNILLVDDDAALVAMLSRDLRDLGHQVSIARDGRAAMDAVTQEAFDAMVLDLVLPEVDGMSVLGKVRAEGMTLPVLIMSALDRLADKVAALDAGADDYVVKPVEVAELDARIKAILRGRGQKRLEGDVLKAGDISISPSRFRAWRAGKAVDLAKIEFNLLTELVRNVDSIVTRAMLLEKVWGYDFEPATNLVEVHIRRLRVKLTADGGADPIMTVRGVGYMMPG